MFVLLLLITCVIHANAYQKNGIRNIKDYVLDTGLQYKVPVERQIFNFKKNGIKIDVKVVPSARDSMKNKGDDNFPEFPIKDIGKCILEFSLSCIRKRFVRFLETVNHLDEITLVGQDVKLVRNKITRRSDGRAMNDTDVSIERSVDDLFDSFTLRITLPRWDSKRVKNQIDVMMDDTAVAEGRGKKEKGGGCGGKGGKCKMMMMGMLMMVKMKMMGIMAIKGLMMGGMSLMISMMMLSGKFGKGGGGGGGGPWQGGGGGGGGQLKEIILLTKSSGGGGGGSPPSDSYGAPPSSSYGAPPSSSYGAPPSSSYGAPPSSNYGAPPSSNYGAPPSTGYGVPSGGGGGGGWGRSFDKRPMTLSNDNIIKTETADGSNNTPMIGEAVSNADSVDYPDYEDYQDYQEPSPNANPSPMTSNWNTTNYIAFHEYKDAVSSMKNNSKVESTGSAKGRTLFTKSPSTTTVNAIEKSVNSLTSQPDTAYMDEWQATAEKISSNDVSSSNSNARVELHHHLDPRSREVPLLRGI